MSEIQQRWILLGEPTEEMLRAAEEVIDSGSVMGIRAAWAAMLAAARGDFLTPRDYEEVLAGHRARVREIDVLLNGEGAAAQASLIDLFPRLREVIKDAERYATARTLRLSVDLRIAAPRPAHFDRMIDQERQRLLDLERQRKLDLL